MVHWRMAACSLQLLSGFGKVQDTAKLLVFSKEIRIEKGVRQGDTLSPNLFTAALEEIFKRTITQKGIRVNGVQLNNLRFADDIILFAENIEDLHQMLTSLDEEGKKDGMKINKKITKIMCNNHTKHKNPKSR